MTYRANHFRNPLFDPESDYVHGAWGNDYSKDMKDGRLTPTNMQGFDELTFPALTPGVYTFSCMADNDGSVVIWNSRQLTNRIYRDDDGLISVDITIRDGDNQDLNRVAFENGASYWNPQIELSDTYHAAVAGGGFASSAAPRCRWRSGLPEGGDAR